MQNALCCGGAGFSTCTHKQRIQLPGAMTLTSSLRAKGHCSISKTIGRAMKLTAIFLFGACITASAKGFTQTVSLSEKDAPIEQVFKAIEKQTGYAFFFDYAWIGKAKKVTVQLKNATLEQALNACFKDQPLTYKIVDKTIVVKPKQEIPNPSTSLRIGSNGDIPPPIDITGKVTDVDGNPLVGANVRVKGTNKGTTTDNDGVFVLKGVDENAVLEISYVGYETYTVAVNNKTMIVVSLKVKPSPLDEIQIQAYGTTTRRTGTGDISTVKAKDIEKQPVNNPLLAIEGRVPGLFITQTTGFAGSGVSVQIQGQTTMAIGVGTDPLYVVDGVPYPSRSMGGLSLIQGNSGGTYPNIGGVQVGGSNPLSFINPADIESIDILKDADATAIYGSRAANGAILITTKKGKAGKTKVNFNLQNGIGKVGHFLDVLNREQYLLMRHEAFFNDGKTPGSADYDVNGTWDTTRSTNWQKELIGGTAHYTDLQADVSGGTTNTQFLVGTGYHKETTVFPGDLADQRGSLHFNINNTSPNQKFSLQLTGNFMADDNKLMSNDLTGVAVTLSPVAPNLYNADGGLNWAPLSNGNSTWTNPLAYLYNEYSNKTNNLIGNLVLGYKILPGLNLKSSFGYNNLESEQYNTFPLQAVLPENRLTTLRQSKFSNSRINSWIFEPSLDYKVAFGRASISSLIGATFLDNTNTYKSQSGSGYSSDLFIKNISAAPTKTASDGFSEYKYNATYGRITFNWADKYIVNLTGRRDGSSRFGYENKFHNFGSIAGAWIFSKESFFINNLSFISYGKLRASYGTTGNDQIGDYRYLNLYNPISGIGVAYQNTTGLTSNGLSNPYLQWEETRKLQFGLDLGFFKDRVLLNAIYYQNRSSNQLLDYQLPIIAGFGSITRNFPATIENTGWEISLNTKNIQSKNFQWSSNINLTISKNKLLEFPGIETSSYASSYKVGQPVTILNRYHLSGVDPTTGAYWFAKADGTTASTPSAPADLLATLNTAPKFYGGFQNSFSYKGFNLDFLFQFVKQIGLDYSLLGDGKAGNFNGLGNSGNQPINVLNRWQKTGDAATVQKFYSYTNLTYFLPGIYATLLSDGSYTNASYIRFKNVSLSWQVLPKWTRVLKVQSARIYLQGQNLLTITGYKGIDPETKSSVTLPPLRVITAGVQIAF